MEVLILVGAFQALFFAVLVLSKKGKSISDRILAVWLFVFASHLSFVYYSFLQGPVFYIEYGYIPSGILVVYYSLMYVYTQSLIAKENIFKAIWLVHLIPIVVIYIFIYPMSQLPYEELVRIGSTSPLDPYVSLILGISMLFVTLYITATLRLLKKHNASIRNMFSYDENINLNWLKILIFLLILLWVAVSSLIIHFYFLEGSTIQMSPEDQMIIDVRGQSSFVVFVFLLGFFGIKQQVIYSRSIQKKEDLVKKSLIEESLGVVIVEKPQANRYKKSGLRKEDSELHLKKLLLFMDEEKPYLNGKLSLKDVADSLNISTNYLSQVINENLNKNFFDFVNSYRVDMVKQKMTLPSNQNYTMLSLAYECGFNSKSSFNSIFKKQEGLTPTEFLKQV
jgi:AraC-like DNA-binding protein